MTLEELNEKLDSAILHEEQALPVYVKHINSAFDWLDLSNEKKQILKEKLEILSNESRGHITLLGKVKAIINK